MLGSDKSDYYEVLNVSRDASKSQIREAYIRMRNTFSGQNQALYSLFDEAEAMAMLDRVEQAFRALNDDYTRAHYTGNGQQPSAPQTNRYVSSLADDNRTTKATRAEQAKSEDVREQIARAREGADLADGMLYKKLREIVGVTEDEMQARTKIGVDHIRGIETNTFDRLPKPIFVKGFLRSYFRYLGIKDAEPMVTAFAEKYQAYLDGDK